MIGNKMKAAAGMAAALVACAHPARAEDKAGSVALTPDLTIDAAIGVMNGMAKEYVFDAATGAKISRLDWKISNIALFSAGVKWRPVSWLMMGARASTNLSSASLLNDYDFDVWFCPPAPGGTLCHSNHPNTQVTQVFMGDVFVGTPLSIAPDVELTPLVGYKYDTFKWHAYNGWSNYTAPADFTGLGITMRQSWQAAYIGLALNGRYGAFGYDARLSYSPFAKASQIDHHHNRSLIFSDSVRRTGMFAAHLGLSYAFTPMLEATLGYDYQRWGMGKSADVIRDLQFGGVWYYPHGTAGASQQSHTVSLGMRLALGAPPRKDGDAPAAVDFAAEPPSWEGFHAGLAMGGVRNRMDWRTQAFLSAFNPPDAGTASQHRGAAGAFATAFLGYSRLVGPALVGVEADLTRSSSSGMLNGVPGAFVPAWMGAPNSTPDAIVMEGKTDASLRLRLGYLMTPNLHLYVTGGPAIALQKVTFSCAAMFIGPWCYEDRLSSHSRWARGLSLGAGAEWAMSSRWFARAEYRYSAYQRRSHVYFADSALDTVTGRTGISNHRLSLGIGYRM